MANQNNTSTGNHTLLHLNEADFEQEVTQSSVPVLIDFWAEWCAPCRMFGPTIESLATEYGDRAKIAKVDVDANQALAQKFTIQSIPTTLLFVNGEVVDRFTGVVPKQHLEQALDRALNASAA